MFAARPMDIAQIDYGCRSGTISRTTSPQQLDLPMAESSASRSARPRHISLPPLHDLSDWSFSPEGISGPVYEDETFDNTTLWSKHRYICFSDASRSQMLFTSPVFEGEVACHTSLIKLRRECKSEERWIQVERWSAERKSWMTTFTSRVMELDFHLSLATIYREMQPVFDAQHMRMSRRRSSLRWTGFQLTLPTIMESTTTSVY